MDVRIYIYRGMYRPIDRQADRRGGGGGGGERDRDRRTEADGHTFFV